MTPRPVFVPAMAAAIALGAQLTVPLGALPFTLQSLFVLLAGFLLGSCRGTLAVALYLAAGAAGLPVFAGGTGGLARLLGPTGGFLLAFLPAAAIAGLAVRDRPRRLGWAAGLGWGAAATAVLLAAGLAWLGFSRGLGPRELAATGLGLLPGAALKLALAILAARWAGARRG